MKYVIAIIPPEKLEDVINNLSEIDVTRLTVSDGRGRGALEKTFEVYRGAEYAINYRNKIKLEIGVNEDFLQPTIDTLCRVCHTGVPTDGCIFVLDLLNCINIGSGKTGPEAI